MNQKLKLGELLVNENVITAEELESALQKQKEYSLPLGETLIKTGLVTENNLLKILGKHLNFE